MGSIQSSINQMLGIAAGLGTLSPGLQSRRQKILTNKGYEKLITESQGLQKENMELEKLNEQGALDEASSEILRGNKKKEDIIGKKISAIEEKDADILRPELMLKRGMTEDLRGEIKNIPSEFDDPEFLGALEANTASLIQSNNKLNQKEAVKKRFSLLRQLREENPGLSVAGKEVKTFNELSKDQQRSVAKQTPKNVKEEYRKRFKESNK